MSMKTLNINEYAMVEIKSTCKLYVIKDKFRL